MAFLYRSRRKRTGAGCKSAYRNFLMWQSVTVTQIIREANIAGYSKNFWKRRSVKVRNRKQEMFIQSEWRRSLHCFISDRMIFLRNEYSGSTHWFSTSDVKQNPLYEDTDLAYLDTHYGGVKKYQWWLFLAIHGVVVKKIEVQQSKYRWGWGWSDRIYHRLSIHLLLQQRCKKRQKRSRERIWTSWSAAPPRHGRW